MLVFPVVTIILLRRDFPIIPLRLPGFRPRPRGIRPVLGPPAHLTRLVVVGPPARLRRATGATRALRAHPPRALLVHTPWALAAPAVGSRSRWGCASPGLRWTRAVAEGGGMRLAAVGGEGKAPAGRGGVGRLGACRALAVFEGGCAGARWRWRCGKGWRDGAPPPCGVAPEDAPRRARAIGLGGRGRERGLRHRHL